MPSSGSFSGSFAHCKHLPGPFIVASDLFTLLNDMEWSGTIGSGIMPSSCE